MFFGGKVRKNKDSWQKNPTAMSGNKKRIYQKKWFWGMIVFFALVGSAGGFFVYKTGYVLNKISDKDSSVFESLLNVIPGVQKGELEQEDDRINVLLLGMRGQNVPGGGLLADSIMVVSLKADENKVAIISIPRDLYVKIPETENRSKINAIYAFGEENGKKQGLEMMKKIVGEVTGLNIHYSAALNFIGFKQLIDAIGGIEITLETPFYETTQFVKGNECGGEFILPKGVNVLDGEKALCYVRARENTSDFDRAKRQQVVLKAMRDKLISMGTLSDFGKVSQILSVVGDNVRTDMSSAEMRKFFEKYIGLKDAQIYQRVFENSPEGLLEVPQNAPEGAGYILVPRKGWDDYSEIQQFAEIFSPCRPKAIFNPSNNTIVLNPNRRIKKMTRTKKRTARKAKKDKDKSKD